MIKTFSLKFVAMLAMIVAFTATVAVPAVGQSKGNTFENDLLALTFNGTAIADLAENDASSPLTSLYLALHSANPGEAGTQDSSECAYTGYAREAVARTSGGFTVIGNAVTLTSAVDFGAATAGTCSATYFSVGVAASGTTKILYYGPVSPPISIAAGVTPRLGTGTNITED